MLIRLLKRPDRREVTPESFCSTGHPAKSRKQRCAVEVRRPTDQPITPMPGEIEAVRTMLAEIEGMLAGLFGAFIRPRSNRDRGAGQGHGPG